MVQKVVRKKIARKVTLPVPVVSEERMRLHSQAIHVELVLEHARKVLTDPSAPADLVQEASELVKRMHERMRPNWPKTHPARVQFMLCLSAAFDQLCMGEADTDNERAHMAWTHFTQVCPEYRRPVIDAAFSALLTAAYVAWRTNYGKARAIKALFDELGCAVARETIEREITELHRHSPRD